MKMIKFISFPLFGTGKISSPLGGKLKGGFLQDKNRERGSFENKEI